MLLSVASRSESRAVRCLTADLPFQWMTSGPSGVLPTIHTLLRETAAIAETLAPGVWYSNARALPAFQWIRRYHPSLEDDASTKLSSVHASCCAGAVTSAAATPPGFL